MRLWRPTQLAPMPSRSKIDCLKVSMFVEFHFFVSISLYIFGKRIKVTLERGRVNAVPCPFNKLISDSGGGGRGGATSHTFS